ncbi:MAG: hypothetical protein Kow0013_03480 [Pararhodobacter sp.]
MRAVFHTRSGRSGAVFAMFCALLLLAIVARADGPNAPPLTPPPQGLRVFHLGHSLVGRDMPAMVEQLARAAGFSDHHHESQLGWGTSLRAHWYPEVEIAGYEQENDHPRFRPAHEAIASGDYDAIVMTEMVELRDAIRWHDSPRYLARWVEAARAARPDVRIYLYQSWHDLRHPEGWLPRLERDPAMLWEGAVLAPVWADEALGPVHVVPVASVLAALTRAMADGQGAEGLRAPEDLFREAGDGTLDTIHFNGQGEYLVALVHVATLYHRPVEGLPHRLLRADGTPAEAPSEEAARLMQRIVWDVVRRTPHTGIPQEPPA